MTTRRATVEDIPKFAEYMQGNLERNHFDPEVLAYPTTRVMAIEDDGDPALFVPYTLTLSLDSMAPKPGLSSPKKALALRELLTTVIGIADQSGIGEIHFQSDDEPTIEFAQNHGFEVLEMKTLRLKPRNFRAKKVR